MLYVAQCAELLTFTSSGFTSLSLDLATLRQRGVHEAEIDPVTTIEEMVKMASEVAVKEGFSVPGKPIVLTGGMPVGKSGTTNLLRIVWPENEVELTPLDGVMS
jgi:pyruvate kinase